MIKNIAHRGFSGRYPENTLLAFQKAIEEGADGIELDVHLTRDGVPVIIHDERLERTTNGRGFVRDQMYADLRMLDAGGGFGPDWGLQIPTLEEYFAMIKNENLLTNIELKTEVFSYPGIEQKVTTLLKVYDIVDCVIVSSFNRESLLRMKNVLPEVRCGLLTEEWPSDPLEGLVAEGIMFLHPAFESVTPERVAEAKAHGIGINTWTVNEEEDIRAMVRMGVDAVITNYPDRVGKIYCEFISSQPSR